MKYLPPIILFLLLNFILFVEAQTKADRAFIDKEQEWLQSILSKHDEPIKGNTFLFYCTGHDGIVWSVIGSDSASNYLYNGTTRKHLEEADRGLPDTLSFIRSTTETIEWGFDSLASASKLLKPITNKGYNPMYNQLYLIKDNNVVFSYNNRMVYYAGNDSVKFNYNLSKLEKLMFWLAGPSCRKYLPIPGSTN